MEANVLERIERFLSGRMSAEESKQFEKELRESKELAEQTKEVAYIIHSINQVGLKRDNERIRRIYTSVSADYKRFVVSIAAMLAVVLVFATVVSVPVYQHVVKPVIEKVFHSSPTPKQASDVVPSDTISVLKVDSLEVDTVVPVVTQRNIPQETPELVSYSLLKNYQFGDVTARREGKNVVCSFTMKNEVEDAEIQMHSARAKDGNGKNYLAKYCLLNGRNKRIVEKWKKDEEHLIEVTIVDVPEEVVEFEGISFSFQSEGDSLKQKSQSIILKVGEIK